MSLRLSQQPRSSGGRIVRALLAIGFCLVSPRAGPADLATLVQGGSADSECGSVPRVCVLPFFDSQAPDGFNPDLTALLETALRQEAGLRIVSGWSERRSAYQMEPWLARSAWPTVGDGPQADVYFGLRRVWVERAARLVPSDFWVSARIVRTGSLATLMADTLPATGVSTEAIASFAKEAQEAEDIPAAMRELASAVAGALGRDRTRRCLTQAWALYRSGSWPIGRAIQEAQSWVEGQPDCLECRILLLGLLQEGGEPYAEHAEAEARRLVAAWRDWTDETRRTAAENDLDPFDLLCGREAARADWAAVEATARLGSQAFALHSRRYDKWHARSLIERGLWEEAQRRLQELARYAHHDPEIKVWLEQAAKGIQEGAVEEEDPLEGVGNQNAGPTFRGR